MLILDGYSELHYKGAPISELSSSTLISRNNFLKSFLSVWFSMDKIAVEHNLPFIWFFVGVPDSNYALGKPQKVVGPLRGGRGVNAGLLKKRTFFEARKKKSP